jgi:hypothetical protein
VEKTNIGLDFLRELMVVEVWIIEPLDTIDMDLRWSSIYKHFEVII